jgi:copper ion binding protein
MAETTYSVQGMTCGHCASAVTEEITRIAGVRGVDVDVTTGSVVVTSEQPVDRAEVAAAVTEAGYQLVA